MARARNIKPGFFTNEELAECSLAARLCFAGLWLLADREGRLEDRPKRIKGQLFPYDSFEVEPLLRELAARGFIRRYMAGDIEAIQVLEFAKHQTPHYSEKSSVIMAPNFLESPTPSSPPNSGGTPRKEPSLRGGRNPLNPDSLIPESLNPDSPIPDPPKPPTGSLFADGSAEPPAARAKEPAKRKPKQASPAEQDEKPTAGTWRAYSHAYEVRYRVPPVRNQTVNSQLAALVKRLGADEAPAVAAHYVRSNNARYVGAGHTVGMLLMDAEKLRTEWATGQHATTGMARQADRTATNLNAFGPLIEQAMREEGKL